MVQKHTIILEDWVPNRYQLMRYKSIASLMNRNHIITFNDLYLTLFNFYKIQTFTLLSKFVFRIFLEFKITKITSTKVRTLLGDLWSAFICNNITTTITLLQFVILLQLLY